MNNNRITWVDTARGISIFLVVLGHTILPYDWLVYVFSFHMPLFFLLSGYLYNPEKYPDWWVFFKRKAQTLLWPYLVFFLLNYIYWILRFNSHEYLQPFIWMVHSSNDLTAPFIPLWFLTCLFVTEIYFYFLQKYLQPTLLFLSIIISAWAGFYLARHFILLPWGADIALVASLFYYLGFVMKNKYNFIERLNWQWLAPIGLVCLIANFFLARQNYQMSMFYRAYGTSWLFWSAAVFGTFGWLILSKFLKEKVFAHTGLWEFLGQNSLIILCCHTVFYYFVSDFFHYELGIFPKYSVLFAFIETTLAILFLTPLIYLINLKLPFLIGKFRSDKKQIAAQERAPEIAAN